jgi:Leucine rich repeat variant
MVEQGKQKIIPADADECIKFVAEHREEIAEGLYDLHVEKTWAKAFEASDLLLIASFCPGARPAVASATSAADLLERFAMDADGNVREAVADNPKAPAKSLERLADDPLSSVRMAVAGNLNTPAASLEKLATDGINYVRWSVANNEQASPALLKRLMQDPDFHVRNQAKQNPNTPKGGFFARLLGRG